MIERCMFVPVLAAQDTVQTAPDANLRKCTKRCIAGDIITADRFQKPQHSFLNQVFTVAAHQEKWAGTNANQTVITSNQYFLCLAVALGNQTAQGTVFHLLKIAHNKTSELFCNP